MKEFLQRYLPVAGAGFAVGFLTGILVYAWAYLLVMGG